MGVVSTLRKMAPRILPLLVLIWTAFVVLGGAAYIAKHSGADTAEDAAMAGTGMGLCAATAAILFKRGVGRLRMPRSPVLLPGLATSARLVAGFLPVLTLHPPPPLPQLLQVFRT